MRTFRPILLAALVAVAAIVSSASPILAAGATTDTYRETYRFVEDHAPGEQYIIEVEGIFHITTRPDGRTSATNDIRQVQTHVIDGVVVDVIESNQSQFALLDGEETVVSHAGGHHRYATDDVSCQTTIVWQVVDGELVVQQFQSICR